MERSEAMVGRPMARRPLPKEEMKFMLQSWTTTTQTREGVSLGEGASWADNECVDRAEANPIIWPEDSAVSGDGCFGIGVMLSNGSNAIVVCVAIVRVRG